MIEQQFQTLHSLKVDAIAEGVLLLMVQEVDQRIV